MLSSKTVTDVTHCYDFTKSSYFFSIWFGRHIVTHRSIDADIRNVLQWHSHLNVWRRPQSNHVIKWWYLVDSISNRIIHWLNLCIGNALTTALRYSYQDFHYAKKVLWISNYGVIFNETMYRHTVTHLYQKITWISAIHVTCTVQDDGWCKMMEENNHNMLPEWLSWP